MKAPSSALLPRLHLFEFIDQDWYPSALRDLSTDYLRTVSERMGIFDAAAPVLARAVRAADTPEVLDLGSGGGGPLPRLCQRLQAEQGLETRGVLSDLYPNARAAERARARGVDYLERPVDALHVPPELCGVRTLFNALHHFSPGQVRRMLADAQARRVPFASFEIMQRTPTGLLTVLPVPLMVWLLTPLIRPLTLWRLLFTYVLPVAPLAIFWDGLVSALRAHSPEELRALTDPLSDEGYRWEVGEVRAPGKPLVTYVLGLPLTPPRRAV